MDQSHRTKRNLLLAVLTLAGTTLFGGVFGPQLFAISDASNPALKEYADLLATTKAWYADDLASDKLVYASVHGMLGSLDPHTNFLEPEEYGAMQEKQRGSFFGLGIIISKRNGKVTVITPVEGSPAERLGIRAGDIIDRIEGEAIDDLAVDAVVKKLKGPKGTKVRITIVRPGLVEPLEMTVTRAEIPTNSVAFSFMLDDDTAYIRLKDFTQTTVPEMLETWAKMEKLGMKRLVLDLRGNPGGLLDQAIGLSDFFVRKGEKVVFTRGRNASSEQVFNAPGRNSKPRIPVVVLINKGSASAAEIVAGALQDHDRGLIVGQTSWGKGLVQSVYTLTDGAGLALTTAKYYTPAGRCIQRDYREVLEYLIPGEEDLESDDPDPLPDRRTAFRTDSGRTVYGGGGITPDVSVKVPSLSRFAAGLFARGVFFEFAVDYRMRHPSIPRDFQVTDEVRTDFTRFVDSRPTPFDKPAKEMYAAEKDPAVIDRSIREELMNTVYSREAGYRVQLEGDPQLKAAVGLFPEAAKLAGITGADAPKGGALALKK
jgi:carboxyl-terminal processing protease